VVERLRVFDHIGFFLFLATRDVRNHSGKNPMKELDPTMAQQVAQAISAFQEQRTGYPPKAVTVVLSDDTLVVTLHEALSPAEKALASTPEGRRSGARVSPRTLQELRRLAAGGDQAHHRVAVGEAAAEVETTTGAVVQASTSGTMVQVFRLAGRISAEAWNGNGLKDLS